MGRGEEEVETLSPIMIHVPLRLSNPLSKLFFMCSKKSYLQIREVRDAVR